MANWKPIFGFALLGLTAILAAVIAIHHVEQQTSYGLDFLLGSISTLSGAFAQWAFTKDDKNG